MHDYKFYLQVQTEAELFLLLMIIIENTSFIEEIWIILRLNRCSDTQQEFKPDRQEGLNCW
jgi:hypothetical protein